MEQPELINDWGFTTCSTVQFVSYVPSSHLKNVYITILCYQVLQLYKTGYSNQLKNYRILMMQPLLIKYFSLSFFCLNSFGGSSSKSRSFSSR